MAVKPEKKQVTGLENTFHALQVSRIFNAPTQQTAKTLGNHYCIKSIILWGLTRLDNTHLQDSIKFLMVCDQI